MGRETRSRLSIPTESALRPPVAMVEPVGRGRSRNTVQVRES